MSDPLESIRVAVIGLGTMGRGIARTLLGAGVTVNAYDAALGDTHEHGLDAVVVHSGIRECVADVDMVFEAVYEDLDVKETVLKEISAAAPDAVIASNTSTFRPGTLAPYVDQPARLLVAHFFNPSDVVPLVEVVPHSGTDPDVTRRVIDVLRRLGKRPVLLRKEMTGFVANRLQAAILRESLALIEAGVVDAEGIDEVVISALGPRWAVAGPIGVADLGGLDIFTTVCAEIFPTLDNSELPPDLLVDLVGAGRLGAKSGRGFYEHSTRTVKSSQQRMAWMFAMEKNGKVLPPDSGVV